MDYQKQIDELRKELQDLKGGNDIPISLERALSNRLVYREETISTMTRVGSASASVTRQAQDSNGDFVTVPAYPDGFLVMRVLGKEVIVPYFNRV